jgi:hypothetical protein
LGSLRTLVTALDVGYRVGRSVPISLPETKGRERAMVTTAKQQQTARARAAIERWGRDIALAQRNGDVAMVKKIRAWIADRKRLLVDTER